jgi:N-acetylneuraminic acid mutarotase
MRRAWFIAALSVACGSKETTTPQATPTDTGVVDAPAVQPGDPPTCGAMPANAPPPIPRGDHGGALDATDKKLVIYGGDTDVAPCGGIPKRKHTEETFVLDVACGSWKAITGPNPGARARHVMATDVDRDRAIAFGGRTRTGDTGPYTLFNDVWAFDFKNETWSAITTSGTGPSPRANSAGAIDRKRGRLIVMGGNSNTSGTAFTPLADTFALDLKTGAWKQIMGAGPTARLFHAMAVDDDGEVLYLFGGGDENAFTGPFFKDMWALDLKTDTWKKLSPTGTAPIGRIQLGLSFDREKKRVLMFGGHDDGNVGNENDIHALDVASMQWSKLAVGDTFKNPSTGTCKFPADFTEIDKTAPERRSAFAFAPTSDGRAFVVHGGKSDCGLLTDTYWWNDLSEKFFEVTKAPVGLSCLRYSETCTSLCG